MLLIALHLAPATSCRAVAHIGDSTSLGMVAPRLEPEQRLAAQYARAGVGRVIVEAAGGRSLREHRPGRETGLMVARRLRESGFTGCWVIALGTNDAANIARGGRARGRDRIEQLLDVLGEDPVLWVDAVTVTGRGHYAAANMARWNEQVERALAGFAQESLRRRFGNPAFSSATTAAARPDRIHLYAYGRHARGESKSRRCLASADRARRDWPATGGLFHQCWRGIRQRALLAQRDRLGLE